MADAAETLKQRMATSATGWGVVLDGVLNIRTISETPNAAAVNGLYLCGYQIKSDCTDIDCRCLVGVMARLLPKAKLVRVAVEVVAEEETAK